MVHGIILLLCLINCATIQDGELRFSAKASAKGYILLTGYRKIIVLALSNQKLTYIFAESQKAVLWSLHISILFVCALEGLIYIVWLSLGITIFTCGF